MQPEFTFIEGIRSRAKENGRNNQTIVGIGDDAAVFVSATETESLISTDLLIEDIDFKREYLLPSWLGHKVLAVSLSDIAAMGGKPRLSLLSLGIPSEFGSEFWTSFFDGYFALADRHGVSLSGGDTSSSPDRLVCDSIAIGECAKGRAVTRGGARVGDDIWVTGTVGAAATGLRLLLAGERVREVENDAAQSAVRRHLRPDPPVEFGRMLGESGLAHSMIDVSDGLAQDLSHICESSSSSAEIDHELVPVAPEVQLITTDRQESLLFAISGGEDFELLFTADQEARNRVRTIAEKADISATVIGRIVERREELLYLFDQAHRRPLIPAGYEHFK
jgi:thiamine-monophosphate kinase